MIQITEELREVLYLDEARLVAVDHLAGIEIFPTDNCFRKAFSSERVVALDRRRPLIHAVETMARMSRRP